MYIIGWLGGQYGEKLGERFRKRVTLAFTHFLFFIRRVYKDLQGNQGYPGWRVNFFHVNTPGWVTLLPGLTFQLFPDTWSVTAH